jgi:hypothetical protein
MFKIRTHQVRYAYETATAYRPEDPTCHAADDPGGA